MTNRNQIWQVVNVLCLALGAIGFGSTLYAQDRAIRTIDRERGRITVQFPPNTLGEKSFIPKDDDVEQRQKFNAVIDSIAEPYIKLLDENEVFMSALYPPRDIFRVRFVLDEKSRDWENPVVNSKASQPIKSDNGEGVWLIQMYGGLFRQPEITPDGFALVVCHEIGHHFAGFPFTIESAVGLAQGLAAEGQADYFATHFCLRNQWRNDNNAPPYVGPYGEVITEDKLPFTVKRECARKWNSDADRLLCQRIAMAGFSVATLWGAMDRDRGLCENQSFVRSCLPDFDKPDPTFVRDTLLNTHPPAQCRLDTYFHRALCTTEFGRFSRLGDIPGKFKFVPENSPRARNQSDENACSLKLQDLNSIKPFCWHNPGWPFVEQLKD